MRVKNVLYWTVMIAGPLKCPFAKQVWGNSSLKLPQVPSTTFQQWFATVSDNLSSKDVCLVVIHCWSIWFNRNKVRLQQDVQCPYQVADFASSFLNQFLEAQDRRNRTDSLPMSGESSRWSSPPIGTVKINFDGAIFSSIKAVGIGVVIRDCRGRFCAGLSKLIRRPLSVESVETLAACCALDLGIQLGYSSIVLEGDALSVVEAIGRKETNFSEAGHLIELIQSSAEQLMEFSSSWVRRSANGVADALAHYACQCNDSVLWRGISPDFIGPLILRESSN